MNTLTTVFIYVVLLLPFSRETIRFRIVSVILDLTLLERSLVTQKYPPVSLCYHSTPTTVCVSNVRSLVSGFTLKVNLLPDIKRPSGKNTETRSPRWTYCLRTDTDDGTSFIQKRGSMI